MTLRRLPPVSSPLTTRALWGGLGAALGSGAAGKDVLYAWLRSTFAPRHAILTDSGTTALTLAIRAAQRSRGRGPIALPAYACYDLATASDGADADVLLYDLDPLTLGPDWDSVRRVLAQGVSSLVVVHLFGIPVDVPQALLLADAAGALVIEDTAQGIGGGYAGRPSGVYGALSVLSFGRGKGLTGGGGGALLVNRDDLLAPVAEQAGTLGTPEAGLAGLAKSGIQWALGRPSLYALPAALPFLGLGETVYRRPRTGAALSHASAGILRHTIGTVPEEAERRRSNAALLLGALRSDGSVRGFEIPAPGQPGYLRLPLLVSDAATDGWRTDNARRLGIVPGYPRALVDLEGFGGRVRNPAERFGGARELARGLHTMPTHGLLDAQDLTALTAWLQGV